MEPFKSYLKREVAPGLEVQSDKDLSEYGRRVAHTVYHPAGTTKIGDVTKDVMAVVGPDLKIRGIAGVRIADAGVFPSMVTIKWAIPISFFYWVEMLMNTVRC